jgi:hypothetical protein
VHVGEETLTREQAQLLLHDHFGEDCYFGLWAEGEGAPVGVVEFDGPLTQALEPADSADVPAPVRDLLGPLYAIGGQPFVLPPLPGAIVERDGGLDFALGHGLTLRIAWLGDGD